ncbi:hypothetical protein MHOL44478_25325 [Mycobacterium holsaticum DSM 44478]|nr:hypothetical protein [Mycolicibacterium holsaticum DSM 44478 = JCM 12374]
MAPVTGWAVSGSVDPDLGGAVEESLQRDSAFGARQRCSRTGVRPTAERTGLS